jgi:hypothetical protein
MAPTMKEGILTLIFKNKGIPEELQNWRPISLLNLDITILSKVLANRIKERMEEIINPQQTCGEKTKQHV